MNATMPNFWLISPELLLLAMGCVTLVVVAVGKDRSRINAFGLSVATLVGALILTLFQFGHGSRTTFSGMFVNDRLSNLLDVVIYLLGIACFVYARDYLRERSLLKGEFFVLGLFAILGMMVMNSAYSLLIVYLGFELMSLSLYALVAFHRDNANASEAAMKYFVLGAIASGMLLYGMSMLYGAAGTLNLAELGKYSSGSPDNVIVLVFGTVFVLVGLAFKIGAVPFHMWLPDVYDGAPAPVTALIGSVSKIAAFTLFIRLLVDGLQAIHVDWGQMLIAVSVLSLFIGNLFAIAQTNIKRMLGYSTIAHVGFILLGVAVANGSGYSAATFYTIIYTVMATAAFAMVIFLSRGSNEEADQLDDFKGLNQRHPWFAFMMLLVMFSMAGVPPTVGFYAKLVIVSALLNVGLTGVAVFAVIMSVIGAFYYLRVVKLMYFDAPQTETRVSTSWDFQAVLSVNGLALLVLGIFPNLLMHLVVHIA